MTGPASTETSTADGPARAALSESDVNLLLEVLRQAKLTVWAADNADSDFAIRLWTDGAERIYGFRRDEALGRNYVQLFVNPQERAAAVADHARIVETGREFGWNFAADDVAKDGTVRTILGNSFRIWDAVQGKWIVAELGIDISDFGDITLQMEQGRQLGVLQGDARQQLKIVRGLMEINNAIAGMARPDERGLEKVVRAVRDGVHLMLSKSPLCRVWMFDDAETARLALGSDELPGQPSVPETQLIAEHDDSTGDIQVISGERPVIDRPGDSYHSVVIAPLRFGVDLRGKLLMFFREPDPLADEDRALIPHLASYATVALVMATLAREQQRRRYEETERIRHAIIQSVLHTVGNEAGLAKLASDSLAEHLDLAKLPPQVRRDLDQVRASASRLGQVMGELVRLNAAVSEPARLGLAESVRTVTRAVERDHYDSIVLEHVIDPEMSVEASEYLLREAVGNLINNAVQAMIEADGGGTLRVSADASVRDWNGDVKQVVSLDIEDSGPGIQPEYQQKVWEFGFTTRGEGHGHGLYHTRGLVGMLGGAVELLATPSPLGGAHFRMFLPAGVVDG